VHIFLRLIEQMLSERSPGAGSTPLTGGSAWTPSTTRLAARSRRHGYLSGVDRWVPVRPPALACSEDVEEARSKAQALAERWPDKVLGLAQADDLRAWYALDAGKRPMG
jgi:hypothetical protein